MPVLKVYKDGVWEELGGTTQLDGGNADTLDGYHASDFASAENLLSLRSEINNTITNSKNTWYGTCSTSASTTAKVVTTSTGDFSLKEGNVVYVLFTYYAYASSTLNVDGTGAKSIKVSGTSNVSTYQWGANEVVGFVYDGTYFRMLDGMIATTTYYGMTKLSSSTSSTSTSVAATSSAVKAAYDLANSKAPAYTYGTTDLTAGSSALETGKLYFVYE